MKRFLSLSLGVESTTMLILYGKGATAIFSDTGSEHEAIYQRMHKVVKYVYNLHGGDFRLKIVRGNKKYKGVRYTSLRDYEVAQKFLPNHGSRYCTGIFKIEPIDRYLSTQGECELLIGLNADETPGEIRTGNYEMCDNVNYLYPLHADNIDRDMCEEILHIHGLHPHFQAYMNRGGCKECFFKSKEEYKAMYFLSPSEFMDVKNLEREIQDRRLKPFNILQKQSMQDIENECLQELKMFPLTELIEGYNKIIKPQNCGAFCRR